LFFGRNTGEYGFFLGLALEAAAGKEWFVSNRWGLGIAVGFTYHSLPDGGVDENWRGWSIPIRFSATFN
jgi:hypothetical protein